MKEKFANKESFSCKINLKLRLHIYIHIYKYIDKTQKAISNEEKKLFGISILIPISVIVASITSYSVLDSILRNFKLPTDTKLESLSKRQNIGLLFCLVFYFAGSSSLFWKRFEVNRHLQNLLLY